MLHQRPQLSRPNGVPKVEEAHPRPTLIRPQIAQEQNREVPGKHVPITSVPIFNLCTGIDTSVTLGHKWKRHNIAISIPFSASDSVPQSNLKRMNDAWKTDPDTSVKSMVIQQYMKYLQPGDVAIPLDWLKNGIGKELGGGSSLVGRMDFVAGSMVSGAPIPLSVGLYMCYGCANGSEVKTVEGARISRNNDFLNDPLYAFHVAPEEKTTHFTGFIRPKQSAADPTFMISHAKEYSLSHLHSMVKAEPLRGNRIAVLPKNPVVEYTRIKIEGDVERAFREDERYKDLKGEEREVLKNEILEKQMRDELFEIDFSEDIAMKSATFKAMVRRIIEESRKILTLNDMMRFAMLVVGPNLPNTSGSSGWDSDVARAMSAVHGSPIEKDGNLDEINMVANLVLLMDVLDEIVTDK